MAIHVYIHYGTRDQAKDFFLFKSREEAQARANYLNKTRSGKPLEVVRVEAGWIIRAIDQSAEEERRRLIIESSGARATILGYPYPVKVVGQIEGKKGPVNSILVLPQYGRAMTAHPSQLRPLDE